MGESSSSLVVKNGNVLLAEEGLRQCDVLIECGLITKIGPNLDAESKIDAHGAYVVPGLIDLHTHGIGYKSTEASTLQEFAAKMATRGATRFFPTLFAPPERIIKLLNRHRSESDELRDCYQVAGFRLESPYLAHTGSGLPEFLAPISPDLTKVILEAGGGHIKIWDISPELPGAAEAIGAFSDQGIICSLAHTTASIDQARAAVDAGAKLVTHFFDTFELPEFTEDGVYPAGLVDYLLVEDRVTCEIIADGTHVHPLLVEKALRCKTHDRLAFVTDGNYGAGLPDGEYDLPAGWGRAKISGSNNGVRLVERGLGLAGSALTALDLFRNAVQLFGQSLASASRLCSGSPARLMGLNAGLIASGKDGDVLLLEKDLSLRMTIAGGRCIYSKENS